MEVTIAGKKHKVIGFEDKKGKRGGVRRWVLAVDLTTGKQRRELASQFSFEGAGGARNGTVGGPAVSDEANEELLEVARAEAVVTAKRQLVQETLGIGILDAAQAASIVAELDKTAECFELAG